MLAQLTMIIILQHIHFLKLYVVHLNTYSVICELYLNKTGGEKRSLCKRAGFFQEV